MNHCQTLRLHRQENVQFSSQKLGQDLFIAVYRFEKGLSLRLGRPSSIRDVEIAPSIALGNHRATRSARIQGQVFDQLYSASAMTTAEERGMAAWGLAEETKEILVQIRSEVSVCTLLFLEILTLTVASNVPATELGIRCASYIFAGTWFVTRRFWR